MSKTKSTQAQAATMIRKTLKEHGIKASIKSRSASMMTAVDVVIKQDILPATRKEIERYVGQFEYGHFDGMTDMYEYSNTNSDLPQVKYAHVSVDYSDEIRQEIFDYLCAHYASFEGLTGSYSENVNKRAGDGWVSDHVYRVLSGMHFQSFWNSRKQRVAA